jgi:hypothetical protein
MSATVATTVDAARYPTGWRVTPEGTVPVADVVRSVQSKGLGHNQVDYPVRLGLVEVVNQHGQGRRRYIRAEDGLLILACAAVAMAAGVALAAILRGIRATGAQLTVPGIGA